MNKNFYVELEQKMELEPFLNIKRLFFNFKRNLKCEIFGQGTFLCKVYELLLISLHSVGNTNRKSIKTEFKLQFLQAVFIVSFVKFLRTPYSKNISGGSF